MCLLATLFSSHQQVRMLLFLLTLPFSSEKPRAHDVNYEVLRVLQRWGAFIDPVSQRAVSAQGVDRVEV